MQSEAFLQAPSVEAEFKYDVTEPLALETLNPHEAHSIILRQVPAGSRVLDAGCATGYLGRCLVEHRQCIVDGIEVDPDSALKAREYLRQVWIGSVDNDQLLAQISETYDVILCAALLEHLQSPEIALQRMRGLLNKGGVLIAGLPNVAH